MNVNDRVYVEAWRARARAAEDRARRWREERLREAAQAARELVGKLGATRVWLFGSLARGDAGPGSDVDLMVEGLDERRYLEAIDLARGVLRTVEVDLLLAQWASSSLRDRVRLEGRRIDGE